MELGIRLQLAFLSLSNTILKLERFGVKRLREAIHDWVHKADLQPATDVSPDHVALDETVIQINGQQFWLYAAVNPETNQFLHIRLFTTTTTALTQQFLQELREKHDLEHTVFLVDHAKHLAAALQRAGLRFHPGRHGTRNAIERVCREVKRRTFSFSNSFSHVEPATAESWLQAFAVWGNSLN
jgi:putative transposase